MTSLNLNIVKDDVDGEVRVDVAQDRESWREVLAKHDEFWLKFSGRFPATMMGQESTIYRPVKVLLTTPEVTALQDRRTGFLYLVEHARMLSLGCRMTVEFVTPGADVRRQMAQDPPKLGALLPHHSQNLEKFLKFACGK